ncbi:nucleotidyltransferase domain-containing protein [Candidatus Bipolaricaulota bacterium]|nr:nucleotidyltransferase domain-containing protein [Candidatus Bipolaricaulota bacterium]
MNEREELLRRELARLLEFLKKDDPPPEKVILFGSMARGEPAAEWTDLDIVIIQPTSLPFFERAVQFFERFQPKVAMDVFIYTPEEFAELVRTSRFFQEEVLEKGKVLYERSSKVA